MTVPVRPILDRVLVERVEAAEMAGSLVLPASVREHSQEGVVLAVGCGKRTKRGGLAALDVAEGDVVVFPKLSGSEISVDGSRYLILREDEILGVLAR